MVATYNPINNTITINGTGNTLSSVFTDINNINVLEKNISNEYILKANIEIIYGGELIIDGDTLKFNDLYRLLNHGDLNINNSLITSINTVDIIKRGFIKATRSSYTDGYTFNLTNSTISYLGPGGTDIDYTGRDAILLYAISVGTIGARIPPIINNNIFEYNNLDLTANGRDDIVTNNIFRNAQGSYIVKISNHGTFDNNTLYNNTNARGYTVFTWEDAIISNNTFYDNYIGLSGIMIKEGHGGAIVKGNLFYNNYGDGSRIVIDGSTRIKWSYVENNTILDKEGYGIYIVGNGYLGSFDVLGVVRNNIIDGAGQMGIRYSATGYFGSQSANHMRVYDNIIRNTRVGIDVEGNPHNDSVAVNNVITGSSLYDIQFGRFADAGDSTPKFINLYYNQAKVDMRTGRFFDYKYLDIKVIDNNGNPISGTIIDITNNIDSNFPSININGDNKTSFITGSDGHIPLPSDPMNSAAILDFYKTSTTQQEMSYTITATYSGFSNSATVTPDNTWYRSIPDSYQNTVTIQLPIDISVSNIMGKVTDSNNNPIQNVSVSNSDGSSTITDINGNYTISNLPPGNYTLTVSKTGYISQSYDFTVLSTETITKDFTLLYCPVPICEINIIQL